MNESETTILDAEKPLAPLCTTWLEKIRLAQKHKQKNFGEFADEAMAFYLGPGSGKDTWDKYMRAGDSTEEPPEVKFQFIIAKVAELVQIFGPILYHRNPVRTVTPRKVAEIPREVIVDPAIEQQLQQLSQQMQDPAFQQNPQMVMQLQALQMQVQQMQAMYQQMAMAQAKSDTKSRARAGLLKTYLNYTPNETDLKTSARRAVVEALIKGMGLVVTESYQSHPQAPKMIGSFYRSVDTLLMDPDAEVLEDCTWIAFRCVHPTWQVAEEYGISEDILREKGLLSYNAQAESSKDAFKKAKEAKGDGSSNDLLCYWKIYSKMGMGDRLQGMNVDYRDALDRFGDNVYLVVAEGIPYPLNLKNREFRESLADEESHNEAFVKVQWPVPFWLDGEWPFTPLAFHEIPNSVWPMSHIRPALPELKFLNWGMSFLAEKVRQTARTIFATKKSLDDETKNKLINGAPTTVVEVSEDNGKIQDIFQKLNMDGNHKDMWEMIQATNMNCDKRTGLSETMYASPGGMRSATEAQVKQQAANVRPDDMANKVEDFMSRVARKEALAAMWLLEEEDIVPVLGPGAAQVWMELIAGADPQVLAYEYDYRVEAGSAKKPNKDTEIFQMTQMMQTAAPVLMPLVNAGVPGPWNALMSRWCESIDIEDYNEFLIPPPPPPDPAQQQMQQQQMQLEQAKVQAELQGKKMDAQLKQLDAQIRQAEGQQKMELERQKMEMERQKAMLELALESQKSEQELRQDQQVHQQEMMQKQQMGQMDLRQAAMQARQQMAVSQAQAQQQIAVQGEVGKAKVAQAKQMAAAKPKPASGKKDSKA
jgi:hypothetical protein